MTRRHSFGRLAALTIAIMSLGTLSRLANAESCDAILANGINNIRISKGASAAIATSYYNYCLLDFSTMSDSTAAQAEVEIYGSGAGSGSFDRKKTETKLKTWCQTNKDYAESHKSDYNESRQISDAAVNAWTKCKEIETSQEVKIEPNISAKLDNTIIVLKYTGNSKSGVRLAPPLLKNWVCTIDDPAKSQGDIFLQIEPVTLNCVRAAPTKQTINGQDFVVSPSASIQLAAGTVTLGLDFEAVFDPSLPEQTAKRLAEQLAGLEKNLLPVGAVVPFFASSEQIAAMSSIWLPADGRTVEDKDSPLFGVKLPDLTSRFVMGAKFTDDVLMSGGAVTGGNAQSQVSIAVNLKTERETITRLGGVADNTGGPFTVDTNARELQRGVHIHEVRGEIPISVPVLPPFRKLLYMVKVR